MSFGNPALWTDAYLDAMRQERDAVAGAVADEILAGHQGTSVDYAVNVWSRAF